MAACACSGSGSQGWNFGVLFPALSPVPIRKPGEASDFTEFAVAAVAGAAQPRPMGRVGEQRSDQCCAELEPLGHLWGEKVKTHKVSNSTIRTGF